MDFPDPTAPADAAGTTPSNPDHYLSLIFNNAINMMALFRVEKGPAVRLMSVNRAYLDTVRSAGYAVGPSDLLGRTVEDLFINLFQFDAEDTARHLARYREALAATGPITYEEVHDTPGGRYYGETSLSPIRGPDGSCAFILFSSNDVTVRRRAESALKLSEFSVQEASLPTLWVASDSRILRVNRAACELLGHPEAALLALSVTGIDRHITKGAWPGHWDQLRERKRMCFESEVSHKSGRLIPVEVELNWLEFEGREYGFAFIRDLSERKRAEAERRQFERKLQETQKLESLGVLAGGIAHDFNNLLTGVLGNAGLATLELPPNSPVQEYLEAIAEASRRAADLCRQMLAYSGKGRFVMQRLSLNRLIGETTHLLQLSVNKKAVLRFDLDPALPAIEADGTQVRQVIMNLVINASEAIGDKAGVISLSTGLAQPDPRQLADAVIAPEASEGTYACLVVSDSGCGMTDETRRKIFDPFFTTKFAGRGLGLAAVLGIVRGHRGALSLNSEPGRGTTFKILFPCATGTAEDLPPERHARSAWRGQGCVLVVDDEKSVRSAAARILKMLGFEVVLAADGNEALTVFGAEPDRFALVLMDLTMPGLDGRQAFAEMRSLRKDQRIVLMSGFNEEEAISQLAGAGPSNFLQKPFDIEALCSSVRGALES